jgi:exosome complex exonuclease RRP6
VYAFHQISWNEHVYVGRPLPDELVMYARKDTHYLLYIYDMMQNALLDAGNGQNNLLLSVFQQSTEICKRVST